MFLNGKLHSSLLRRRPVSIISYWLCTLSASRCLHQNCFSGIKFLLHWDCDSLLLLFSLLIFFILVFSLIKVCIIFSFVNLRSHCSLRLRGLISRVFFCFIDIIWISALLFILVSIVALIATDLVDHLFDLFVVWIFVILLLQLSLSLLLCFLLFDCLFGDDLLGYSLRILLLFILSLCLCLLIFLLFPCRHKA